MARRTALLVVVAGTLLLAGCAGSSGPPDSKATDRALEAETDYVSARLPNATCLGRWGVGEYTTNAEATVVDRTNRGVVVEVQRPYSWERGAMTADAVSNARYLVTESDTVRQSGPPIDPC